MNFTREPIIETIITSREGHKLVIRNTKNSGGEEYIVDSIQVVSFGHSFFFRSTERPKLFLVPVSDYEVVETKETRVVLKNATFEKAIKIAGGREPSKASKEKATESDVQEPAAVEQRLEKKRERRRHRRRKSSTAENENEQEASEENPKASAEQKPADSKEKEGDNTKVEAPVSTPVVSRLIPPPLTLISEKYLKEKAAETPPAKETISPSEADEEPKKPTRKKKEQEETPPESSSEEEGGDLQRVAQEPAEAVTSTSFSSLEGKKESSFFGKFW